MEIRPLLSGISSYFPGFNNFFGKGTGGTISSRYCYSVWLRHLVIAYENGLSTKPEVIAELGPGDSLGVGLAGLISGASKLYAFDIVKYANNNKNLEIFNELLNLFNKRENIPDSTEFPKIKPLLNSYNFPKHILTDERLHDALKKDRIDSIRSALINLKYNEEQEKISYFFPYYDEKLLKKESVDMIYSQAVMEYVDDLEYTYNTLYRWLKVGGFMSHEIDFKSHGTAKKWNGHWTYSDFQWKLIKGNKEFFLNRQPHSVHINLMRKIGFEVVCDITLKNTSEIQRKDLTSRLRKNISDDDLIICSAFVQAVKKK